MIMRNMKYLQLQNHGRKVCALVAASLILPALAYADHDNDKDSYRDNHGRVTRMIIMGICAFRRFPRQIQESC